MKQMKEKILILAADLEQTLPIARSLYKKGYEVHGVFSSKYSYGYGSRYIKKRFLHANAEEISDYYRFVKSLLEQDKYVTVLPMRDSAAEVMCKYRDELLKYTTYVMPDTEGFERGFDKQKLMEVCKAEGYPHPETYLVKDGNLGSLNIDSLRYPVLIKPNHTFGARGMTLCNDKKELQEKFPKIYQQFGECHIQTYIPEGGHQVEVQVYINEKQELVQGSVIKKFRWYPNKGGSSCCNISCKNDRIVNICYNVLKSIGWVGFADFDTIEDPRTGELLIMEINPRVPACVKSTFASGIDWADVIVGEYLKKEHKTYQMDREVYLRFLGVEVLWFLKSENKWHTKPNWFKFFGSDIYYQDMSDWTDPMPFIRGSIGNIKKQLSPEFRKQKAGV